MNFFRVVNGGNWNAEDSWSSSSGGAPITGEPTAGVTYPSTGDVAYTDGNAVIANINPTVGQLVMDDSVSVTGDDFTVEGAFSMATGAILDLSGVASGEGTPDDCLSIEGAASLSAGTIICPAGKNLLFRHNFTAGASLVVTKGANTHSFIFTGENADPATITLGAIDLGKIIMAGSTRAGSAATNISKLQISAEYNTQNFNHQIAELLDIAVEVKLIAGTSVMTITDSFCPEGCAGAIEGGHWRINASGSLNVGATDSVLASLVLGHAAPITASLETAIEITDELEVKPGCSIQFAEHENGDFTVGSLKAIGTTELPIVISSTQPNHFSLILGSPAPSTDIRHTTISWCDASQGEAIDASDASNTDGEHNINVNYASPVQTPVISPDGGSFNISQEVTLSCETEGVSIYYTLNGNDPTEESTLYEAPFTILDSVTVKAKAFKEGSDPSEIATAEFVEGVPALYTPEDEAVNVALRPTFECAVLSGANHYELQVANDEAFEDLEFGFDNIPAPGGDTVSYQITTNLQGNHLYYWRMRAWDNAVPSDWSAVRSFTTLVVLPGVPTPTLPANFSQQVEMPVTLVWEGAVNATSYDVQVSKDPAFMGPFVSNQTGILNASLLLNELETFTLYFWRVRGVNDAQEAGAWSEIFLFKASQPAFVNAPAASVGQAHGKGQAQGRGYGRGYGRGNE